MNRQHHVVFVIEGDAETLENVVDSTTRHLARLAEVAQIKVTSWEDDQSVEWNPGGTFFVWVAPEATAEPS